MHPKRKLGLWDNEDWGASSNRSGISKGIAMPAPVQRDPRNFEGLHAKWIATRDLSFTRMGL